MRQKKQHFTTMSERECADKDCKKKLKANVVNRKPTARFCFKHYWQHRISDEGTTPTRWNMRAAGWGTGGLR